jgi:hypothetical protein
LVTRRVARQRLRPSTGPIEKDEYPNSVIIRINLYSEIIEVCNNFKLRRTADEAPVEMEQPNNNEKVVFDYHRCPFVFSFTMGENDLGEVHVMSSPFVIQHKFVQALGEYCFRMPRQFQIFAEPEVNK